MIILKTEEQEYGFVVVKEHYTKEEIHEIQCFCFEREIAERERNRIQNEIDPEYNEWRVGIESFVEIAK